MPLFILIEELCWFWSLSLGARSIVGPGGDFASAPATCTFLLCVGLQTSKDYTRDGALAQKCWAD